MAALALLGLGLGLLGATDPAPSRLRWLVDTRSRRWLSPAADGSEPATGRRLPAAARSGLARLPHRWQAIAVTAAAATVAWWSAGPIPGLLAAAVAGILRWCWRLLATERAIERDRAALIGAVSALIEEYAAGATVAAAFTAAAPAAGRFGPALAAAGLRARIGDSPEPALDRHPELAALSVACALAGQAGGSFAALMAGVRDDLVSDRATRGAVGEAVAGPRASAVLLSLLPLVGLVLGVAMGAHPGRVLVGTPLGLASLSAGVLLDLAGFTWTVLMTRQPR
jgi:tight adherence protein B